ncbi:MAG: hypothetical protein GF341_09490 [candidate division Zixibacteria bacterium]|nr:hypothetical protein [candidate division Zixibacteria bacterium]
MTWDGERFWVMVVGNPPRLATLTLDGVINVEFELPVTYWDRVRGDIAWRDSLIWMPLAVGEGSPTGMNMIAVDPGESQMTGTGVIVQDVPAPATFRDMLGMTAVNGELLIITGYGHGFESQLYRMSQDHVISELGTVTLSAGPITWDGESLWMLHSGPSAAWTKGVLLSRFTVPEYE